MNNQTKILIQNEKEEMNKISIEGQKLEMIDETEKEILRIMSKVIRELKINFFRLTQIIQKA